MEEKFKQQLLTIQALQIEASDMGFCMHVIVRGGNDIESQKRSHVDSTLFKDSKQVFSVCEFENYGENSNSNIEVFIWSVKEYLELFRKDKANGNTNSK